MTTNAPSMSSSYGTRICQKVSLVAHPVGRMIGFVRAALCARAPLHAIPSEVSSKRVGCALDERTCRVSAMAELFRTGSGRRAQDPDCCVSYAGRDHQARNLSALRRLTFSPYWHAHQKNSSLRIAWVRRVVLVQVGISCVEWSACRRGYRASSGPRAQGRAATVGHMAPSIERGVMCSAFVFICCGGR
jgi:hypothetical protein